MYLFIYLDFCLFICITVVSNPWEELQGASVLSQGLRESKNIAKSVAAQSSAKASYLIRCCYFCDE
jgi:hypothetical protein